MKNHDQQNKPLIITEYGVLLSDWYSSDFSSQHVRDDFMYPSFENFLKVPTDSSIVSIGYPADQNRLVQRWIWYSLDDDSLGPYGQNYNGNLFHSGGGMTSLGTYWQQYVAPLPADSGSHY